jgi:hypothetical protein
MGGEAASRLIHFADQSFVDAMSTTRRRWPRRSHSSAR